MVDERYEWNAPITRGSMAKAVGAGTCSILICTAGANSAIALTTTMAGITTATIGATDTTARFSTYMRLAITTAGFYGWAYNPWAVPVAYGWGWGAAPWYGYYGGYFAPYPVYPSAAFWLTDYMIAASLQDAYAAQAAAAQQAATQQAAADQAAALTPEVKAMVADEVKRQLALENAEAAQNAANQDIDPASSGISRMLSDGQPHVFITGGSLDLVDEAGAECAVSQGDIIEVAAPPAPDAAAATAVCWRRRAPMSAGSPIR